MIAALTFTLACYGSFKLGQDMREAFDWWMEKRRMRRMFRKYDASREYGIEERDAERNEE